MSIRLVFLSILLVWLPNELYAAERQSPNMRGLRAKAKEITANPHDWHQGANALPSLMDMASRLGCQNEMVITNFIEATTGLMRVSVWVTVLDLVKREELSSELRKKHWDFQGRINGKAVTPGGGGAADGGVIARFDSSASNRQQLESIRKHTETVVPKATADRFVEAYKQVLVAYGALCDEADRFQRRANQQAYRRAENTTSESFEKARQILDSIETGNIGDQDVVDYVTYCSKLTNLCLKLGINRHDDPTDWKSLLGKVLKDLVKHPGKTRYLREAYSLWSEIEWFEKLGATLSERYN